jgi:hypothetical protein
LLPKAISQVCAAMTSGTTSVISGRIATMALPGKSKRAVNQASGTPISERQQRDDARRARRCSAPP